MYVRPFPRVGDGRWQVSSGGGFASGWSRRGNELFFIAGETMMAARVSTTSTFATTRPEKLFAAPLYIGAGGRPYDVSADGRFLIVKGEGDSTPNDRIVVVENWISEFDDSQNPK